MHWIKAPTELWCWGITLLSHCPCLFFVPQSHLSLSHPLQAIGHKLQTEGEQRGPHSMRQQGACLEEALQCLACIWDAHRWLLQAPSRDRWGVRAPCSRPTLLLAWDEPTSLVWGALALEWNLIHFERVLLLQMTALLVCHDGLPRQKRKEKRKQLLSTNSSGHCVPSQYPFSFLFPHCIQHQRELTNHHSDPFPEAKQNTN
jgi:hypothetical protein